jgi:hypothetical protein
MLCFTCAFLGSKGSASFFLPSDRWSLLILDVDEEEKIVIATNKNGIQILPSLGSSSPFP